jgi:hypothetical protein
MDSILIFEIDRIYRIIWIFLIAGFRPPGDRPYRPVAGNCEKILFIL